jgi:hypothetical protein
MLGKHLDFLLKVSKKKKKMIRTKIELKNNERGVFCKRDKKMY